MTTKLSKYFFLILGVILGALIGIYLGSILPKATATVSATGVIMVYTNFLDFIFSIETFLSLVLGFFFFELILAMLLSKPHRVLGISIGLLVIPLVWAAFAYNPNPGMDAGQNATAYANLSAIGFGALMIIWTIVFFVSLSIPFLVGIDTSAMEDGITLPQAFCLICEFDSQSDLDLAHERASDTIASRMGFTRTRVEDSDITKLSYYLRDGLRMSVLQKAEKNNTSRMVFNFYTIADDTVRGYENPEEIKDYKSLVKTLIARRTPNHVLSSKESVPTSADLKLMADGLCRRALPARNQLKGLSKDFPKNHPQWFSLILLVVGGAVVEIIRWLLFR